MNQVLFIDFFYNPNNEIASKRLQGIAKYLPNYNWQPIVIVPRTQNKTVKIEQMQMKLLLISMGIRQIWPNYLKNTLLSQCQYSWKSNMMKFFKIKWTAKYCYWFPGWAKKRKCLFQAKSVNIYALENQYYQ